MKVILHLHLFLLITLRLNENRETVLPFDSLDVNARQILVLPDDDPSRNLNSVNIEFPENREYTYSAKLIKTDPSYFGPEFASFNNEMPVFNRDSSIMIEPFVFPYCFNFIFV